MNPIALVHLLVAAVTIAVALPLVRRKIKRNPWYGIRLPDAFKSEERWFEVNEYGGRLLLRCGVVIGVLAVVGLPLQKPYWIFYTWSATAVITIGLAIVLVLTMRYVARTRRT